MGVRKPVAALSALAGALVMWLGCSRPEATSLTNGGDSTLAPIERSSGSDMSQIDEFSALPFFVPAMGPSIDATDCDLSGDPYSSCI